MPDLEAHTGDNAQENGSEIISKGHRWRVVNEAGALLILKI